MRTQSYARTLSVWDQAARDADCTLWLPGRVPMFFRRIPAGSFRMGARGYYDDEEPVHVVTIADDFYLGTLPVTQEQYRAVARRSPALRNEPEPSDFKGPRRPVENVTWRDAIAFTDWLTRERGTSFPEAFTLACLPTEAEWEYACRAGTETEYYAGDGEAALGEVAWYDGNSGGATHPVDERDEAHPFGLYGMHGNVDEWCHDVFDASAYRRRLDGDPDPGTPRRRADYQAGLPSMLQSDLPRVLRGGSWYCLRVDCRSAVRGRYDPGARDWNFGFRVCLVCGPAESGQETERGAPGAGGRGTVLIDGGTEAGGAGGGGSRRAKGRKRNR